MPPRRSESARNRGRAVPKSPKDRLQVDEHTLARIRKELPNKFLLATAQFLQRALLQVDRAGPYHSALMAGIFHDHHLKATGKTPPDVQILINIPGMRQMPLQTGQCEETTPLSDSSSETAP